MTQQTEQEMQEELECAKAWKENAKAFMEQAEQTSNKHIKKSLESLAASFSVNAKILETYGKSRNPSKDKYVDITKQL